MAIYKLFPSSDASIYSGYPAMNTGLDAILEVSSIYPSNLSPSPRVARSLIKFQQSEIDDVINNKISGSIFSSSLKTYIAKAQGMNLNSTIEAYVVSGSWENGTGQYLDEPQTVNGVGWTYSNFSGSVKWPIAGFGFGVTASFPTGQRGGGNWYTASNNPIASGNKLQEFTQSFGTRSDKDLDINVTTAVKLWNSASANLDSGYITIENNGFLVKWDDSIEFSPSESIQPLMNFYSVDTNTIYPPVLEFGWDDSSYSSTLPLINTPDLFVSLDNNPGTFYSQSINRFRLNVRPDFPARVFQTASRYTTNFRLHPSSSYAIKDLDTNEYVVEFSNFTKISCDNTSSYFDVYMNGLQPERYYEILIKTLVGANTIVKNDQYYFKVING